MRKEGPLITELKVQLISNLSHTHNTEHHEYAQEASGVHSCCFAAPVTFPCSIDTHRLTTLEPVVVLPLPQPALTPISLPPPLDNLQLTSAPAHINSHI